MFRKTFFIALGAVTGLALPVMIVLLLHVIAIAGIYGYQLCHRRTDRHPAAITTIKPAAESGHLSLEGSSISPPIFPVTYTVKKGDRPAAVARSLNVSCDELLKLNKIDDPKKLQVGAVLKVPPPKTTAGI